MPFYMNKCDQQIIKITGFKYPSFQNKNINFVLKTGYLQNLLHQFPLSKFLTSFLSQKKSSKDIDQSYSLEDVRKSSGITFIDGNYVRLFDNTVFLRDMKLTYFRNRHLITDTLRS